MEIVPWYRERDIAVPPIESLPHTGFIVSGLAAGFLYLTDSNVGLIDGYISDGDTDPDMRDVALDLITKHLILAAKMSGVQILKADTQNTNIEKRALRHGFKKLGRFTSFFMEL